MSPLTFFVCFLCGSLYGLIGDSGHVASGVLSYPSPSLFGLAWWVLPQFGMGGVLLYTVMSRLATMPYLVSLRLPSYARCVSASIASLVVYLLSSALFVQQRGNAFISVCTLLWSVVVLLVLSAPARLLPVFIVAAPAGVVWEGTLCACGLFQYNQPDLYHVSHWIAWLWIGGVAPAATAMLKLAIQNSKQA